MGLRHVLVHLASDHGAAGHDVRHAGIAPRPLEASRSGLVGLSLAVCLAATACGGDDPTPAEAGAADFSGSYTISVTNKTNGCQYPNFDINQQAKNLAFDITQSGANVSGKLTGLAGFYFAVLGIGTLTGTASGSHASITAPGTTQGVSNGCAYNVRATVDFDLTGDTVNGTVTYTNETNHATSCNLLDSCSSTQAMSGNRPPK